MDSRGDPWMWSLESGKHTDSAIISPGVDNNQLPARFSQEELSTALVPIGLTPPPQLPKATSLYFFMI